MILLAYDSGPRRTSASHTGVQQGHSNRLEWAYFPVEPCRILYHKLKHTRKSWANGANVFSQIPKSCCMGGPCLSSFTLIWLKTIGNSPPTRVTSGHGWNRRLWQWERLKGLEESKYARIANIKEGDANTKFFHLKINVQRKGNNYIYGHKNN
jgi:hypothetical protein